MKSYSELQRHVYTKLQEAGFNNLNGFAKAIADLVIDEISSRNQQISNVFAKLPSNATGSDLDAIGEMFGLSRTMAAFATDTTATSVRFYIDPTTGPTNAAQVLARATTPKPQLRIPTGVLISDGNLAVYKVTEDVIFSPSATEAYVKVQALQPGDDRNVVAGGLNSHNLNTFPEFQDIAEFIKVENILPISNGTYTENDENFRLRIYNAMQTQATGNLTAVSQVARNIPGVSDVTIIPNIYGIGTTGLLVQGTAPITSPEIISSVQYAVDNVKPIGEIVAVVSPTYVGVEIQTGIRVSVGSDFSSIQEQARSTIIDYINTQKLGNGSISVSSIISMLMGVPGVEDARVTSIKTGIYDIFTKQNVGAKERGIMNIRGESDEKFYTNKIMCNPCAMG